MLALRHSLRALARTPSFTIVAVLSLALGIGANITIFSLVATILEQPIAGATEPGRLVRVYRGNHSPLAPADLYRLRTSTDVFVDVIGEHMQDLALQTSEGAVRVRGSLVSDGYFAILGVRAALGRMPSPKSDGVDDAQGVVISHALWTRQFAADRGIIGTTIRINEQPYPVLAVAAPDFGSATFLFRADVWMPPSAAPALVGSPLRDWGGSLYATARLAPGVSQSTADAAVRSVAMRLAADDPESHRNFTMRVDDARGVVAELRPVALAASAFLLVMVGVVLLIACANVANLLFARGLARRREMGIRIALGASRTRLVRQLLVESLLLAALGTAAGAVAAAWSADLLVQFVTSRSPEPLSITIAPDAAIMLYVGLLGMATTLLVGLAPAIRATRTDVLSAVREDSPNATGRTRARSLLVGAQVALCTLLLACSTLFVRSLLNARVIDPGFNPSGIVDVVVDPDVRNPSPEERRRFHRALLEVARTFPGVQHATLAAIAPLGGTNMQTTVWLERGRVVSGRSTIQPSLNRIGGDYFATLGIELVAGRAIEDSDEDSPVSVVVVNERFASHAWPDGSALGRRVSLEGENGPWTTVVGIARDTKYTSLGEETPDFMYLPLSDESRRPVILQARTSSATPAFQRSLVDAVRRLDPRLPPPAVATLSQDMRVVLLPAQLSAALVGTFGLLALFLASIGVYGIAAYGVAQRTRELGVRAALGATRRDLVSLILRGSLRVVVAGAAIGLLAALGVARLIVSQLYGVSAADPVTFLGLPIILIATGIVATLVPALRAGRVDPAEALRME